VLPNVTSSATATHQPALIGPIVGGVVGGVAAIALVIIFVYFCFYRNRARDRSTAHEIEVKDQAIFAGPQTPRTLLVTPAEIHPFVFPPNQASFNGTAEKQQLRHPSNSTRTIDPRLELNRRILELQQEMALLQSQNSPSSQNLLGTEQADDWRSNVELLRDEVERLRHAMHSSQGLADQPPPGYAYSLDEVTSSGGMSS